jgi:hypothetical protein
VSCRSESPKYETDHENDHSDRPHDWYPGDEADEKKNQAENHNASMVRTALIKPTATVTPNNGGAVTANNMMRM